MLTDERKVQLEAAYQANITAGKAPYAGVIIRNTDELTWIYDQRNWSSRFWFDASKSRPNLSDADLSRADLSRADLSDANLSRADLSRADLSRANLSDADLSDADLSRADLSDADLSDADLSRADLSRANLSDANLSRADLSRADLSDADLSDANLSRADLSRADLSRANLSDADLSDADLSDANLSDANLSRADLSRADLSRADLSAYKLDVLATVDEAFLDLPYLIKAIETGKINGSIFRDGCEYGCLIGTLEIAAEKRQSLPANALDGRLIPHASHHLAQKWFSNIHPGDTPETSAIAKLTHEWLTDRLALYERIGAAWPKATPEREVSR